MAKTKTAYVCQSCGARSPKWVGQCPTCGQWNAYEEMAREAGPSGPLTALEKLRLGTARDYQPEVVESLARVLSRAGLTLPRPG